MPRVTRTGTTTPSTTPAPPRRSGITLNTRSTTRADGFSAATSVKLEANAAYLPALNTLLDGAKKSIDIVQYNFFSESGDAKAIADKLIAKKAENPSLKVRLFIEADHGDAASRNALTIKLLKKAGIEVIADSKKMVTHTKAVCVDGSKVLAGSHNLSNTSVGKNNETSLLISSPELAKAYSKYFGQLVSQPDQLHPSSTTVGQVTMLADSAYFDHLISMVKSAKTSLDASMYYFNAGANDPKGSQLLAALVDAQKRGVKVRLFLEQNNGSFAPFITTANQAAAKQLKAAGVEVHFDDPNQISHQKFMVRDGREALLGSSNWSTDDFDRRHQLNWDVKSPALAKKLSALLTTEINAVP